MTIRTRLALWYSGLLTLLIIVFSIAVIIISRVTTLQMVDRWLGEVADTIVTYIEIETDDTATENLVRFNPVNMARTRGVSFQLWHTMNYRTGEVISPSVIYDSLSFLGETIPLNPDDLTASDTHYSSIANNNVLERVLTRPVYVDGDTSRLLGVVQVSTPIQSIMRANRQLLFITLVTAGICIGLSITAGFVLSRHALKPVKTLTEAATTLIARHAYLTPLELHGTGDELGELSEVFDGMTKRLEHLINVQKQFIGDVSHEFRTPLATIIGNIDLINTYGMQQVSVDAIQQEAQRLNRMVNDLLLLTRAESGELELEFYPVDLDAIAVAVFKATIKRTKKRDLSIMMDRVQSVAIVGDGERLHQLISNLMHNATKFTPDGGMVILSVYAEAQEAIIEVRDTGIGIAPEFHKRIFDRFFQMDKSRQHWDDSDGGGLGLSIVQWIVNAHHGGIEVQSELGKGSLFRVRLPLQIKPTKTQEEKLEETDISGFKPGTNLPSGRSPHDSQR
jgi:two-component system, OmpR family, sensor kinase